jgi:hypothetical protein
MITLECNYSKKLGLPGYSSHQFSITLRTEISDLAQVHAESSRLYKLLQNGVDSSIKEVGYLPDQNGKTASPSNGNGHNDAWSCSDKQKILILKIVDDHKLDKNEIEQLAQERFSKSVKKLNKLEASGLIEELLEKHGDGKGNGRGASRYHKAGAR